jgi:5-methyltetrahydropteroyltriglutamate--homocysteine methyltransferase
MITHNLGYPRIGNNRELKKACESYWDGKINYEQLVNAGAEIRLRNWLIQKESGLDLIPSNDFSFYDQVLDMSVMAGAVPVRYSKLKSNSGKGLLDLYFAMARGYQKDGFDITAMEMTKWFDTNYHYIVPEFNKDQKFELFSTKVIDEFLEARSHGIITKPVLIGPVSFLLLGKEKEKDFSRLDLLTDLLPVYFEILLRLSAAGAEWIQFDEPFLVMDLDQKAKDSFSYAYAEIRNRFPRIKLLLATYFEGLNENEELALSLPVDALHIDLVKDPQQLESILKVVPDNLMISLGIVDGRNIWKNDLENSLRLIRLASGKAGNLRIMLAPSCSLIHVPCDLELETNEKILPKQIRNWLAFAKQKIDEIVILRELAGGILTDDSIRLKHLENQQATVDRKTSGLLYDSKVRERLKNSDELESLKRSTYSVRRKKQQKNLNLPEFPTTTIGSFPQTSEVRTWRARLKKGELSESEYTRLIKEEIAKVILWQEEVGLDVLVHGEFERNDMVEYFGEMLEGFVFTKNGWVQSYGSRCVKPPVIFGDVYRNEPMTVDWIKYAQSLTPKPVKGMLTGPVTILEWSFVRDDQPVSQTCFQIALAIRDEVLDLEKAGIGVIQIDEPALREGLPLRRNDWQSYLDWAVKAFRLSYAGVKDETQIHTHMCYSEFHDIIQNITALDADVITIECSRSQMELLDVFAEYKYPNDIGPGLYDIHSPRVPTDSEMVSLIKKAALVIPKEHIWVNPDCGLKTRTWNETRDAITEMVKAARSVREYA